MPRAPGTWLARGLPFLSGMKAQMIAAQALTTLTIVAAQHDGPDVLALRPRQIAPPGPDEVRLAVEAARRHPDWYRADLARLLAMLADGAIHPRIAATWKLSEVPEATRAFAKGSLPGKQVVSIATDG